MFNIIITKPLKIICLSGVPGMGKTTYAKSLGLDIVSIDNFEGFIGMLNDFVIDWIFMTTNERSRCVKELRESYPNSYLELHWFKPDYELLIQRRLYEPTRAKRFVDRYEVPMYSEGWDIIKEVN